MTAFFYILFLSLFIPVTFVSVFAEIDDFTTDKMLYYTDDVIVISGNVVYDNGTINHVRGREVEYYE